MPLQTHLTDLGHGVIKTSLTCRDLGEAGTPQFATVSAVPPCLTPAQFMGVCDMLQAAETPTG